MTSSNLKPVIYYLPKDKTNLHLRANKQIKLKIIIIVKNNYKNKILTQIFNLQNLLINVHLLKYKKIIDKASILLNNFLALKLVKIQSLIIMKYLKILFNRQMINKVSKYFHL